MTLSNPLWLLALAVVAAAAAWALWRPSRQVVDVGSLALWQEALQSLGRAPRRRTRRVTASWLLLLLGAASAALALAGPTLNVTAPARHIALAAWPAAELADDAAAHELHAAADALLRRLAPADRVQLLRPALAGGATAWLAPADAAAEFARTPILPIPAGQLVLPPADAQAQQLVRLVPAGLQLPAGPGAVDVELPAALPPITLPEFGAAALPGGRVQFFAATTNNTAQPWSGELVIRTLEPNTPDTWRTAAVPLTVPPGGRASVVRDLPASAAIAATPSGGASPLAGAYLVRRDAARRKIALVGPDEPTLRRFVAADESLQLVASPAAADLVIANLAAVPADRPALVIDPPRPPPPWQAGAALQSVTLAAAAAAADDPVMKGVALEGIAVRRLQPWSAETAATEKVLASLPRGAVLLRTDAADGPRRVYVAFELSSDNTNLAVSESLVVLLANAVRWLAPAARSRTEYLSLKAQDCIAAGNWRPVPLASPRPLRPAAPLPWPGIYRDQAGTLQAVALRGLQSGQPAVPPAQAVAAIHLPAPRPSTAAIELWFYLLAMAILLWITGWMLRVR